jgi:thiol:disulfide interchange protein DsbC
MIKTTVISLLALLAPLCAGYALAGSSGNTVLAAQVAEIPESDLIIYSPETPRYTVTMFTDVNCPFCRRVHAQLDDYLLFDVEIRYAAFPNIDNALEQMHAVWCSDDRKAAISRAKRSEIIEAPGCRSEAVDQQLDIALKNRFLGTPAMVTPAGRVLYGHVTAERLVQELQKEH